MIQKLKPRFIITSMWMKCPPKVKFFIYLNFNLIDTQVEESPRIITSHLQSKMLNFKEFYEQSQISDLSNQYPISSSNINRSHLSSNNQAQNRSKSTSILHKSSISSFQSKQQEQLQTKSIIDYNLNDFLPKKSVYQSNNQNQIFEMHPPHLVTNIFKQNYQPQQIPLYQPRIQQYYTSPSPCSCQKQPQFLQTQRSSVCSCQYSQSSACQSQYASPHSNHSKHRPVISKHQFSQQQQCSNHFQSCACSNGVQSYQQLPQVRSVHNPVTEYTPFKNANSVQQPFNNLNSRPNSKSPIQRNLSNNQLFEDRSVSFLKSSEKKGYNTDDLIRDSESEIDLNEVSTILQEVQINFQEGFNQLLLQQSQVDKLTREQREELAMKILSSKQGINDSQVKTMKHQDFKGPVLTLEALQSPHQQAPIMLNNFNSVNAQINALHGSRNTKELPQINSNDQQTLVTLQQQYMSPCFNQFEETNLTQQQLLQQQSLLSQYQTNLSSHQSKKEEQVQEKSKTRNGKSASKQMTFNKNKKKKSKKQKKHQKLKKSCYNEDEYTQEEKSSLSSSASSDKENQSNDSSEEKQSKNIKKQGNKSVSKGQTVKILKEMSIQTSQSFKGGEHFEGTSSFLEKSDIQIQTEHPKKDVITQINEQQFGSVESQPANNKHPNMKKLQLPPHYKKDHKNSVGPSLPVKQVGVSIPTSKNSTIRTQHFHSQQPHEFDDCLDDESHHQQSIIGHSSVGTSSRQVQNSNGQHHNHQYSGQNLLSPYHHMPPNYSNFDHFKSQCSEVVIRGSSETDISNRIAAYQRNNSLMNIQPSQHHPQHSHQISGCHSIVNHDRSQQFSSIESNDSNENEFKLHQRLLSQVSTNQNQDLDAHLHTGDTFMKHQKEFLDQQQQQTFQTEEDHLVQSNMNFYKSHSIDSNDFQKSQATHQYLDSQGQEDEEEFNYTINLNKINTGSEIAKDKKNSQLPPVYGQRYQSSQPVLQHHLNNTSSTAGFPQLQGYINSQQTGRRSTSIHSSFHSQNISRINSQSSFQDPSYRSNPTFANAKKMSFMDKIILIQQNVRKYLQRKHSNQSKTDNIHLIEEAKSKPLDDSISQLSSAYLNTYKQYLNNSTSSKTKEDIRGEHTYQKNILESLNLTTGNTFMKENKQLSQAGTQPLGRIPTQGLGNSSALVLFSGSTQDHRVKPTDMIGPLESQPSMSKPPAYSEYEFQMTQLQRTQQSPTNNTSLLNLTEESNSALFKLTPLASQNVTQKTNLLSGNFTGQMHQHERTTDNLNYSYSELDSEWAHNQLNKDHAVSPLSVNTTSNKIQSNFGGLISKGNKVYYQRSNSIYSEQITNNLVQSEHKLPHLQTDQNLNRHTQKIQDIGVTTSPISQQIPQIPQAHSAKNVLQSRHEQLLNILKSQDYEQKAKQVVEEEWRVLQPIREKDLNNFLIGLIADSLVEPIPVLN